jgi:pimeloyl-ACP methyl ester carboxylesterase
MATLAPVLEALQQQGVGTDEDGSERGRHGLFESGEVLRRLDTASGRIRRYARRRRTRGGIGQTFAAASRNRKLRAVKMRLLLTLAGLLAVPLAWFVAGKLHRFAYWIGRTSDAELQALATAGWQVERLAVGDGVTLAGLRRAPRAAEARWILFAPGNSQAILAGFRGEIDRLFAGHDVGITFFAYRGFDASGGTPTPAALAADLLLQWRHLRQQGIAADRIEIWGYSLGTPLACQLAAAVAELGESPARLVLLAAGEVIPVMPFGWFGRFLPDDRFDALPSLDKIRCPVAIVHGEADDALPIAGARAIALRLGERATLHALPGKGHFDVWQPARELLVTAR